MKFEFAEYDDIVYIKGQCPNPQCECPEHSLIIMDKKQISPTTVQLNIRCVKCSSNIKTKLKVT